MALLLIITIWMLHGTMVGNEKYTSPALEIDFSTIVGKFLGSVIGGLVAGPIGALIGGVIGGKIGYSLDDGATTTIMELSDISTSLKDVTNLTGATTKATQDTLNSLEDFFNDGGDELDLSTLTQEQIDTINQTLLDAYKDDTISAMSDIWDNMIGIIPSIKADAKAEWDTLFTNYLEQGNSALLETVLNGRVLETPGILKGSGERSMANWAPWKISRFPGRALKPEKLS